MESRNQLIAPHVMDELRRLITHHHDEDTIAVIVLAGTAERGLAISLSSTEGKEETTRLLLAALLDDAAHEVVVALDAQAKQDPADG